MLKSAQEIIKGGWELYAKNWRKFVPFLILLILPTLILSALGVISLYLDVYLPESSFISNIIILAIFVASLLFTFWISIALLRALAMAANNQPFDWKNLFSTSSSLIWPILWTSFLVSMIVLAGGLLLIVPGIIFAIWYNFTIYTVVFENTRGLNAMRASKALVVGRWWDLFWRWTAQGLVFIFLNFALSYAVTFLIRLIPMPLILEATLLRVSSVTVSAILTPLMAGTAYVLYQSAKQNPVTLPASTTPPTQS